MMKVRQRESRDEWRSCKTYLSEDGVAVVGEHDATHGVEEHLEHGLGSERGSHDVTHRLGGLDVGLLSDFALLALGIRVQDHYRRLIVHF